eukprot:896806_1
MSVDHPHKARRSAKAETFTAVSIADQQQRAKSSYMKSSSLRKWLKVELTKNILLKSLSDEILDAIIDNLYCIDITANTALIRQGEMGTVMYIVEEGSIDVFIDELPVTTMCAGECFGELSLMYDTPRAATCKTKTQCKLWCIDRNDFKITLRRCAQKEIEILVSFLKSVPILKLLSVEERRKIAESLNVVHIGENEVIIREGDKCDDEMKSLFYILKKGKAAAFKTITSSKSNEQLMVKSYGPNEYFGERALITNECRAATIRSLTPCVLLTLSRSEFTKTMGSLQMVIENRMQNYEAAVNHAQLQRQKTVSSTQSNGWSLNTSILGRMFRSKSDKYDHDDFGTSGHHVEAFMAEGGSAAKRTLTDFKFIHGIGQGSFATVWLVRDRLNKQTFALKRMSKSGVEDTQQQQHVANERFILSTLDTPFVIKLYNTFQDPLHVYMVLDLGLGGDMFIYLESQGRLSPAKAQFFMGCVVLAFEYLHLKQIVYRDLKPENLVLDFRGYLKLCDLGFAKKLDTENQRTYTVCGTPVYLAPEVIVGKGHSFAVDWWTSGIFLYEMLTGYPPFDESSLVNTYDRILHQEPKFKPKYFHSADSDSKSTGGTRGKVLVDLVKGLLNKKPNQRFGHSVLDIQQRIKQNAWFDGLDWEALAAGQIPSPYRPKLKNDQDTRYFDQDIARRRNERVAKPKK